MYKINDRIIKVAIFDLDGILLILWESGPILILSFQKESGSFIMVPFQASVSNSAEYIVNISI